MSCLDPELIAGFLAGALDPDTFLGVQSHVSRCALCIVALRAAVGDDSRADLALVPPTASVDGDDTSGLSDVPASGVSSVAPPRTLPLGEGESAYIGPYRVRSVVARGGMGVVYRAEHRDTRRPVAIKTVLSRRPAAFMGLREEIGFLKEARHPGVVEILDYDLTAPEPWYAMELLEGETLATRNRELWGGQERSDARRPLTALSAGGGVSPDVDVARPPAAAGHLLEVMTLFAELCEPLTFIHHAGIVHCDLKPANVFLRDRRQPVLMDFGLVAKARGAVGREALHVAGRVRGTYPYVSPEVIRGELPDARADLYALGCMLYESLTGQPPFMSASHERLLRMHLEAAPVAPSALVADLPGDLDRLVLGLLEKRPEDRINQAEDVAATLIGLGACVDSRRTPSSRGSRPAYLFRPRLVGRDAALEQALTCCRLALRGKGVLLFVEGESGIGKTFFASELSQRAALDGFQVVTAECVPVSAGAATAGDASASPLHPFVRLLQAVGDRCREFGALETARLLGANALLLAPYEPALAGLDGADDWPPAHPLPAAAARERLVQAVGETMARLAETQPVLLTLDDLQWADDLSLAVLESLTEEFFANVPIVVLGTFRSDEVSDALGRLAARPWAHRILLGRLDQAGVEQVTAEMLAMTTAPRAVVELVHAQSEGVPFFVAEYLRALTADGVLERVGGRWRLKPDEDDVEHMLRSLALPGPLVDIVRRRVSGLSPGTLSMLEAAAVLGRVFELRVLSSMTSAQISDVVDALAQAVERQVVERVKEDYRFVHDKIRETIYRDLPIERRRALHAAAGGAIRAGYEEGRGLEERFSTLAHHFREAAEPELAMAYLARAGEHALRYSADADAVGYLRDALDLERALPGRVPLELRARWQRQLGEALQGLGRLQESAGPLSQAVALLGRPMPAGRARLGWALVRETARQSARRLLPQRLAARLSGEVGAQAIEVARAMDRLQQAYFFTGQELEFLFATLRVLNLLESEAPTPELAIAYAHTAATAAFIDRRLAHRYFALAHATLERKPDVASESYVEMLQGLTESGFGYNAEAAAHADRALALAEQVGFYRRLDECTVIRAGVDSVAGRHRAAVERLTRLEASAIRRGDPQILAWALLGQCQCALVRADAVAAQELVGRAERLAPELARPDRIWLLLQCAYIAWVTGDEPSACRRANEAEVLIGGRPPLHAYLIDGYGRLAEVRLGVWRRSLGTPGQGVERTHAQEACRRLAIGARLHPVNCSTSLLHRGTFLQLAGREASARKTWTRGLDIARRMNVPYSEARLLIALAGARAPASAESRRLLSMARAILIKLDVPAESFIPPSSTRHN